MPSANLRGAKLRGVECGGLAPPWNHLGRSGRGAKARQRFRPTIKEEKSRSEGAVKPTHAEVVGQSETG